MNKKELENLWYYIKNTKTFDGFVELMSKYIDIDTCDKDKIVLVTLYNQNELLQTFKSIAYKFDNEWMQELIQELEEFEQIQLTEIELSMLLKTIPNNEFHETRKYLQDSGNNKFNW
jgi:hypothetical protein